jgi:hypothetical protein
MVLVVWVRYTFMTAVIINDIDACTPENRSGEIYRKVDDYCMRLKEMVEEFKLESIMKDDPSETLRYLVADHVMTIYSFIIGVRRLVQQPGSQNQVDAITIDAARKVVQFTIDFSIDSGPTKQAQSVCIQYVRLFKLNRPSAYDLRSFISFYPFCAVFSLYEHILSCNDPEECEPDIQLLESIGSAMAETSTVRPDLVPFARTINALNKVSASFQYERRMAKAADSAVGLTAENMPEFDMSAFASFPDLPFNFEDGTQPLGFFRALESDLTRRDWHEGWWDAGAGLNNPMMNVDRK